MESCAILDRRIGSKVLTVMGALPQSPVTLDSEEVVLSLVPPVESGLQTLHQPVEVGLLSSGAVSEVPLFMSLQVYVINNEVKQTMTNKTSFFLCKMSYSNFFLGEKGLSLLELCSQ